MRRRGFLALPFIAAVARVAGRVAAAVRKQWSGAVLVGAGQEYTTIAEALKDAPEGGGAIYLLPGLHEVHEPLTIDRPGMSIVGTGPTRPIVKKC